MKIKNRVLGILAAASLLIIAAGPAQAATYTYTLLGYAYDEFAAPPIQARDGLLYDVGQDQSQDYGIVFNTPLGSTAAVNSVYVFGDYLDGGLPVGGVVQGPDGNLYGTAGLGGTNNEGVIYKITGLSPNSRGAETTLYNFTGATDGVYPQGSLIFDSTTLNLVGTSADGGSNGAGVLFTYNPGTNTFTPLHEFGSLANCADGAAAYEGPVQGNDGNYYGATVGGGNGCSGAGAIYKVTPAGVFTPLYQFCLGGGSCTDGSNPNKFGPLVQYSDGNFYGLTAAGGAHGDGTIYRVTPAGALTTLYSFTGGDDGSGPLGGLVVGSDGNLYGTTENNGTGGYGTVFQYVPGGTVTTLYSFDYTNFDGNPYAGLVQGNDGNFYGVTSGFLEDQGGFVYEIAVSPALPAPVQLSFGSSTVAANSAVTLNWQVLNAFSRTLQDCVASVQGSPAGAGSWTGMQAGSYSAATKLFTGSAQVTPTAAGSYTYALTCGGQESGFATLTVTSGTGKATPTVALSATPNPATVGQVVTIHATASGSGATPTGTVSFIYNTHTLVTLPLAAGTATFSPSTAGLPAGSYLLTASYSGDANYNAAASASYTVTLNKATPTISLSATPNPAPVGQAITIRATATGSGATPTGTVSFKYGALTLVSLSLVGGSASFSPSTVALPAGTYDLTASYSGDANYAAANSAAYGVTLSKESTVTTLTATPNPVTKPAPCTLKATVTRSNYAGTPTGSVTFSVGNTTIAVVALNGLGVASISPATTNVPAGNYPIVATYFGDGGDSGSASATTTVVVNQ
jgi:uncharacterized repeat protein (TIGR03803 family)